MELTNAVRIRWYTLELYVFHLTLNRKSTYSSLFQEIMTSTFPGAWSSMARSPITNGSRSGIK